MDTVQSPTQIKWGVDPGHSEIGFKVKHLMVTNIRGVFKFSSMSNLMALQQTHGVGKGRVL